MQLPEGDRHTHTREFLEAQIAILMGGRIAEELFLRQMTSGAGNDIERATEIARRMVCEFGMSRARPARLPARPAIRGTTDRGAGISEATAQRVDEEVRDAGDARLRDRAADRRQAPQRGARDGRGAAGRSSRSTPTASRRSSPPRGLISIRHDSSVAADRRAVRVVPRAFAPVRVALRASSGRRDRRSRYTSPHAQHSRDALRPRADWRGHRQSDRERGRDSGSSAPSTSIPRRSAGISATSSGCGRRLGVRVHDDAAEGAEGREAGRRRALHELVAQAGDAAARDDPRSRRSPSSRRPRSWRIPATRTSAQARQIDALGEEGQGRGARHRRQPGLRDGRAADHADGGLRARRSRPACSRVQDARIRRLPFQQKIGAGLTTEQFQKKVDDGSVRHVGLTESIAMIADALGWTLDRITDDVQPKLATVTDVERVPRRRSRLRVRHHPGRRRLPEGTSR